MAPNSILEDTYLSIISDPVQVEVRDKFDNAESEPDADLDRDRIRKRASRAEKRR